MTPKQEQQCHADFDERILGGVAKHKPTPKDVTFAWLAFSAGYERACQHEKLTKDEVSTLTEAVGYIERNGFGANGPEVVANLRLLVDRRT